MRNMIRWCDTVRRPARHGVTRHDPVTTTKRTLLIRFDLILFVRYGLVGPNGYGKTTVLRFLAERRLPIPEHMSCLHVEQEVKASHLSALATVLAADTERAGLAPQLERVHCMLDPITAQVRGQ